MLHFFEKCCRRESLRPATRLKTVVEGKQGHALCKILLQPLFLFCLSVEFHENHKTASKLRCFWPPLVVAYITRFNILVSGMPN